MTRFSYLFSPSGLDVIPQHDDLQNVIFSVSYRIAGISDNHQAYAKLTTVLPAPDPSSFINYPYITENQLIQWLEATEPSIPTVKAELEQQLQELESTPETVPMPLPWTLVPNSPSLP